MMIAQAVPPASSRRVDQGRRNHVVAGGLVPCRVEELTVRLTDAGESERETGVQVHGAQSRSPSVA